MYSFESRVRYSETDQNHRLSVFGMVNYFQDSSTAHTEDAWMTLPELMEKEGAAWFINFWQIDINRLPEMGERITVGTNPHTFRGFVGYRNYFLKSESGEMLVIANSEWTFVDMHTLSPKRAPKNIAEIYGAAEPMEMEYLPRKIKIQGEEEKTDETVVVRRHMLDMNGHTNNAQYVSAAADFLPDGFEFDRIRTEYKRAAQLGETMHVRLYRAPGFFTVSLCDENGGAYAITEFSKR